VASKNKKDILDSYNLPGSDYSKAQDVDRKKNKLKEGTEIVIHACSFFMLLIIKFLFFIVELSLLIAGLLLLSKIGLELAFHQVNIFNYLEQELLVFPFKGYRLTLQCKAVTKRKQHQHPLK
jgi:hypothetical protein